MIYDVNTLAIEVAEMHAITRIKLCAHMDYTGRLHRLEWVHDGTATIDGVTGESKHKLSLKGAKEHALNNLYEKLGWSSVPDLLAVVRSKRDRVRDAAPDLIDAKHRAEYLAVADKCEAVLMAPQSGATFLEELFHALPIDHIGGKITLPLNGDSPSCRMMVRGGM